MATFLLYLFLFYNAVVILLSRVAEPGASYITPMLNQRIPIHKSHMRIGSSEAPPDEAAEMNTTPAKRNVQETQDAHATKEKNKTYPCRLKWARDCARCVGPHYHWAKWPLRRYIFACRIL